MKMVQKLAPSVMIVALLMAGIVSAKSQSASVFLGSSSLQVERNKINGDGKTGSIYGSLSNESSSEAILVCSKQMVESIH